MGGCKARSRVLLLVGGCISRYSGSRCSIMGMCVLCGTVSTASEAYVMGPTGVSCGCEGPFFLLLGGSLCGVFIKGFSFMLLGSWGHPPLLQCFGVPAVMERSPLCTNATWNL